MQNGGFIRATVALTVSATLAASAIVVAQQSEVRQETRQETSQKGGVSSASASGRATASSASRGGISQVSRGGASQGFGAGIDPNKRLYAVWLVKSGNVPAEASNRGDTDHMKYMKYLMQDRTLVSEGPFEDGTGYLLVFQTDNDAHAKSIVQGDPAVQSGYLMAQLKGWKWRFGGLQDGMTPPTNLPVRRAGGG